jgi:hypothetical protein
LVQLTRVEFVHGTVAILFEYKILVYGQSIEEVTELEYQLQISELGTTKLAEFILTHIFVTIANGVTLEFLHAVNVIFYGLVIPLLSFPTI